MHFTFRKHLCRLCVVGVALLVVPSCTNSTSVDDQPTTSNETQLSNATPSAAAAACTVQNFSIAFGEESADPYCVEEWAVAQPQEYINNCGDCESLWLFRWSGSEWTLKGTCYQFAPLTEDGAPCTTPDGDELDELPSANVACALWPANSFEENVAATGCSN